MSDGRRGDPPIGDALAGNESSSIDELLDRAVAAINRGEHDGELVGPAGFDRARTHADPESAQANVSAAIDLARRQGATLFELRAALDDIELRGQSAPRSRRRR